MNTQALRCQRRLGVDWGALAGLSEGSTSSSQLSMVYFLTRLAMMNALDYARQLASVVEMHSYKCSSNFEESD